MASMSGAWRARLRSSSRSFSVGGARSSPPSSSWLLLLLLLNLFYGFSSDAFHSILQACCSCNSSRPNKQYCNMLNPGACLISSDEVKATCQADNRAWYTQGCPSNFGWLALIALGLYIISYSPGMGTVPWIVNSEIYPLRFHGMCGGIAVVANWVSNLIVTQTFLSLTQALGTAPTFLLFCGISYVVFVLIFVFVPETKGLTFEEVEQMLDRDDYKPWKRVSFVQSKV